MKKKTKRKGEDISNRSAVPNVFAIIHDANQDTCQVFPRPLKNNGGNAKRVDVNFSFLTFFFLHSLQEAQIDPWSSHHLDLTMFWREKVFFIAMWLTNNK